MRGVQRGRTVSSILTALTSLAVLSSGFLVSFISTPYIVGILGTQSFGVWRILVQVSSYMTFADLGAGNALKWTIANSSSEGSDQAKRMQLTSSLLIWFCALPITLVVILFSIRLYPIYFDSGSVDNVTLGITVGIMMASFSLFCIAAIPSAVLRGENLEYKAVVINVVTSSFPLLFVAFALWMGFGLIGMAVGHLVSTVLIGLGRYRVVLREIPWLGLRKPSLKRLKETLDTSVWYTAWNVSVKLIEFSDVILIGILFGAAITGQYALTQFLHLSVFTIIFGVMGSMLPGIGRLLADGDIEKVKKVRSQANIILWFMLAVSASILFVLNKEFLFVWVGPDVYLGDVTNGLLLTMALLMAVLRFEANLIDATLAVKEKSLLALKILPIQFLVAYVVGINYGLNGVLIAYCFTRLYLVVRFHIFVKKLLLDEGPSWFGVNYKNIFWLIVCVLTSFWTIKLAENLERGWLSLIFKVMLLGVIASSIFVILGMSKDDRINLANRVPKIRKNS